MSTALGAGGDVLTDQKAKKGCLGKCSTVSEGGRGARGTGSPDPSGISNPRVYARVRSGGNGGGSHPGAWAVRGGSGEVVGVVGGAAIAGFPRSAGRNCGDMACFR